ncbi:hypothetical protein [Spiroplasma alleghenense]|uniref:Uncharacterized protein n=1 Tax=Spiroplasma alleghenense TaxID=216931 RepID=A0A345Z2T4_9MOLU|nr:hypothetical protein [Spiroplasma alleghenense]AXK50913.1 hypothetical protein SALLE_v1c02370 [Spiroplasma alleghenense]
MSIKFENVKVTTKKQKQWYLNFKADSGKVTSFICDDRLIKSEFKNIMKGLGHVSAGRTLINGNDMINYKLNRNQISDLTKDSYIERIIPPRLNLFLSLLFNRDFIRDSRTKIIKARYDYLSYKTSKNNQTDLKMRQEIQKIITIFIENSIKVEKELLEIFFKQITDFNNQRADSKISQVSGNLSILLKRFNLLKELNANKELYLTFMQSLWDKVYAFIELRYSCNCEYNSGKIKKKVSRKLRFYEHEWIVKEQLKLIDLEVTQLKSSIQHNKIEIKNLARKINKILNGYKKLDGQVGIQLVADLKVWNNLSADQRFEFRRKQENLFFKILLDESNIIKGKIVEIIHDYHELVLNNQTEQGDKANFKSICKIKRSQVPSLYSLSHSWTEDVLNKLEIKFDWFISSFKISSLAQIYLQILRAIHLKKKNIIIDNKFHLLTKNDANLLTNTIKRMNAFFPKISIIILENNFKNLINLKDEFYLINENDLTKIVLEDEFNNPESQYLSEFDEKYFKIPATLQKNNLNIVDQSMKLSKKYSDQEFNKININPFQVLLLEDNKAKNFVSFIAKIKNVSEFIDSNLYVAEISPNVSTYFYQKEKINENKSVKIAIPESAVILPKEN